MGSMVSSSRGTMDVGPTRVAITTRHAGGEGLAVGVSEVHPGSPSGGIMTEIGYFLSSEEHGPKQLVDQARMASDVGIGSVWISDHFHPWLDDQGESPF